MGTNDGGELAKDLVRGRSRFQAWRAQRKGGGGIPQSLWRLAVRLASTHGVSRTATALRLDYYSLKKRVKAATSKPTPSGPTFIELPSPLVVAKQCLFELNKGTGTTMRLQLVGYDTAAVETLVRRFWNVE